MIYLEIKKQAGPCRLGEIHAQNSVVKSPNLLSIATQNLFFKHEIYLVQSEAEIKTEPKIILFSLFSKRELEGFGILPSFSTGYNVPKKLAEVGAEETIKIAKERDRNNELGASVEGTKYMELAKRCIEEFKERPLLRISYGDKLQKEPRKFVELITYAREKISPNAILYFPRAKPWMFYVLAYMGVDLFDSFSAIESAYSRTYLTKSRELLLDQLKEMPCECDVCKNYDDEIKKSDDDIKLLAEHNFNVLCSALREIREHARKNLLRELVEEKCCSSIEAKAALRILDREKQKFLEKYTAIAD